MRIRRLSIIEISAGRVAVATFATKANRLTLEEFACRAHNPESGVDGAWMGRVEKSLGRLAVACEAPRALVLPGHLVLTKLIRVPVVATDKRDQRRDFDAAEHIPVPLDEVVWSHRIPGPDGANHDVLLVAAKLDGIEPLCEALDSTGWYCDRAMPGSFAMHDAFRLNYPEVREPVIVANIGARTTQLLFAFGDRFNIRTLDLGGNAVTDAVAADLQIDFSAAEALKLQVLGSNCDLAAGSPARAAVQRGCAAFCVRLQVEIRRTAANWRREPTDAAVAIYLAGGGSLLPRLPENLAENLNLRVERYHPLRHVEICAPADAAVVHDMRHALIELVGTAARLLANTRETTNLLPPAQVRAITAEKRQPVWLGVAAMLAVSLLPLIVGFDRREKMTLAAANEIETRITPLHALLVENDELLTNLNAARKREAGLAKAYQTKESWITFLAELQVRLFEIENVWLDRLKIEPPHGNSDRIRSDSVPGKLLLAGRLLDVGNPLAKVSAQSFERVNRLLRQLGESPFVAAVTGERFDNSQDGILRFEVTLVLNRATPL